MPEHEESFSSCDSADEQKSRGHRRLHQETPAMTPEQIMAVRGLKLDLAKESQKHSSQLMQNRELRKFINDHEKGI